MEEIENIDPSVEVETENYTQVDAFVEHEDGTLEAVDFYGTDN